MDVFAVVIATRNGSISCFKVSFRVELFAISDRASEAGNISCLIMLVIALTTIVFYRNKKLIIS